MWIVRPLVLAVAATVCVLGPPAGRGDEKEDKKRRDELEETLRKTEPTQKHEIAQKEANDRLLALLGKAESMELFRLDPNARDVKPKDREKSFHGYEIIHRTPVEPAARREELVKSLGKELFWSEFLKADCFNPRHGLRVVVGKETVDLVICLECHRMKIYVGDESGDTVLLGSKWEAADKVLRESEEKAKEAKK